MSRDPGKPIRGFQRLLDVLAHPEARGLKPEARSPGGRAGMSLVEILVVVVVMALLAAALAFNLGGLRAAGLDEEALSLSRMSRSALMYALTRATTVRLVVDIDARVVTAEKAGAPVLVDEAGRMVETDAGDDEEPPDAGATVEPPLGSLGLGAGPLSDPGLFSFDDLVRPPGYRSPVFQPIDDPRLRPLRLRRAESMRVYLPAQEEPIEEGRVYLLYRDDGTADGGVVHIEDADGRVQAVEIDRLTGRGAVYPYPYLPEPAETTR
ncbi:MAG: prepilin-type N-terminal cleavage/methylation domain-containing protein [Myxococcota bacterium]|nr:prepilin-type N-terminal cleavage/methylation domain-containing protein [Myxococcota bacterium]